MDRRKWIGLGALALAAFLGLGFWGHSQSTARGSAEAALTGQYQRAFYATLDNVQNVHVLLGKAKVSSSKTQLADLFSQVRAQAFAAQENLTQLPVSDMVASRTAKFLTQVGDFAGTMLTRTATGQVPDQTQLQTLSSLYSQSGDLNGQLRDAEAKSGSGKLFLSNLVAQARNKLTGQGKNLASQNLSTIDTQMQKYPGLIYDGPFSDQPAGGQAALQGPPTSADQAGNIALNFIDRVSGVQYQSKFTGSVKGTVPSYRVQVSPVNSKADGSSTVDVASTGGRVAWFLDPRPVTTSTWTVGRAQDKALSFAGSRGLGTFVATYHRLSNNQAIFSLVRDDGGVKIYPQQVKVSVALDNGQVVGFEGTSNLFHSQVKPANKVVLTAQQAGNLVKNTVAVGPGTLSIIPDGRGGELYAYEFSGRQDGDTYLVYINAQNGNEEQILRVADTPNGQLTI
ncbi:MAG TPA: germination protein YpeB [Spirochaetia bacterium]|nr:germination protein YpeB [Spirochaetia bacterium]